MIGYGSYNIYKCVQVYIWSYIVMLLTKYINTIIHKDICNQWAHLNLIQTRNVIIPNTIIYDYISTYS